MSQPTDAFAEHIADLVAEKLAARLAVADAGSPWMTVDEAIAHTRIPHGTFTKLAASGQIPSHGRSRRFFRPEVDEAILGYSRAENVTQLRRAS